MNKKNYVLIIFSSMLLILLPTFISLKNTYKDYKDLKINQNISFYKTNIDKVLNNITEITKEIETNTILIKDKESTLAKINDGLNKYNSVEDYYIYENFNKINLILEKRNLKIVTLNYVDKKFNLELLIKDQNDLDELKQYKYNINKAEYVNNMFLINMTIEVI